MVPAEYDCIIIFVTRIVFALKYSSQTKINGFKFGNKLIFGSGETWFDVCIAII